MMRRITKVALSIFWWEIHLLLLQQGATPLTVWFVKVIHNDCLSDGSCIDDYGNAVGQGVRYLKGYFLEKIDEKDNHKLHKLSKTNFLLQRKCCIPICQFPRDNERLCLEQL